MSEESDASEDDEHGSSSHGISRSGSSSRDNGLDGTRELGMAPEDKSSKTVMSVSGGVVHLDGESYDVLQDNFAGLDIGEGAEDSMSFVNNSSREDKLDEAVSS